MWTGICAFLSLICLITPRFAILYWHRWIQLLVVPYSFYATHGLWEISNMGKPTVRQRNLLIVCAFYAAVAIAYMTMPYTNPVSTYTLIWPASKYSPPTMQSNTVPVQDTPAIGPAMQWLNNNMEKGSCLLSGEVFVNWAKLYLNRNSTIIRYPEKVGDALQLAESLNYRDIYWIWWEENGIGLRWYGEAIPVEFKPVHQEGNIVIYKYSAP